MSVRSREMRYPNCYIFIYLCVVCLAIVQRSLNTDLNCFQTVLVLYFSSFETRRRPRSRRGSRQVLYYVSHELRASLKIQHKDFGKQFLWTMCTGSCHVRHSYYIFSLETWFSYYVHDMKHDGHSMIILWNMVDMVRSWQDHDHEMTMIIVWSYYDHSMVSMFGQPRVTLCFTLYVLVFSAMYSFKLTAKFDAIISVRLLC